MTILSELQSNKVRMIMLATPLIIGSGIGLYYYFKKSSSDKVVDKKKSSTTNAKTGSVHQDALKKSIELKELGNKSFHQKKYHEAINYYTEAIKISPHQRSKELATFYQNRAACHECLEEYDKVILDCTHAIENDKFYIKAYLRRGKAYEATNDYEKASFDYYIAVASTRFQNSDYLKLFNDSMEHYAAEKAKRVVTRRDRVTFQSYLFRHLINRLSRDPLKERLEEYLANYNELVASLLDKNDDTTEELTDDQELILGTILLHVGKHQDGKLRLRKLFDKTHNIDYKVNILVKLAEHASQQPDLDEAAKLLDEAEAIDDKNADIFYMKSQLNIIQKDNVKALHCLEKAIEIDPMFVCAQGQKLFIEFQQSIMLNDVELNQRKLAEFGKLAEDHPKSNEILLLYFQILMTGDDTDKAEKCIQRAISNHRDDPSLYVFHAMIHFEKQNFEKAKELLDEAIKIDSRCSFAYEMLADLCCRVSNLQQALDYLETAYTNSTTFDDIKNLIIKHASIQFQQKLTNLPSFR